jgi:hypothetical protein
VNKRQTQIVGVATVLLAGVSVQQGIENEDAFLTFALPIILIAGLLVFELRDKAADRLEPAETAIRKARLIPLLFAAQFLCVAFTAVVAYQARSAAEDAESAASSTGQENDLSSVESSLSSVDSKLDDIESKLNSQSLELSLIQSRLSFR